MDRVYQGLGRRGWLHPNAMSRALEKQQWGGRRRPVGGASVGFRGKGMYQDLNPTAGAGGSVQRQ